MGSDFYPTIVELARLGASGVGVAIFLMVFVLLFKGKPVDVATAKLREKFLAYGVVFSLALLIFPPLFQKGGGPISQRLAFSPDFDTEKLQPPTIRLPDGTVTPHDKKFELQPSGGTQVLTITMDGTLNQVRNLRQASANLTTTVGKVTEQRDALATQAAAAKPSDNRVTTPALQNLERNSAAFDALKDVFSKSLTAGDYVKANQVSARLRNSVSAAEPAVAVLANQSTEPE